MKNRIAGLGVISSLLLPLPGLAACKLTTLEMPVTMAGYTPVTTVGINGTEVKLVVDSGAMNSMLTPAAAEQLRLPLEPLPPRMSVHGVTGRIEARKARVEKMQLLQGELPNVAFIVGGNEPGGGAVGLLGRNILNLTDAEYDLAQGVIRLVAPSDCDKAVMAYWAGSTPISQAEMIGRFGEKRPEIKVYATVNGKRIKAMFDTGATASLLSLEAARRVGIDVDKMQPAGLLYGVGRGIAQQWIAKVESFELGGERISNNRLRVGQFKMDDIDMLIGADFFLSHRIYVSQNQERIFFTYNGGPAFALNQVDEAGTKEDSPKKSGEPLDGASFARRGAAAAARGDARQALADLDRACELDPAVATHFTKRGMLHLALKEHAKALQDFDEALRVDPSEADARLNRAYLKAAQQEREAAVEDLRVLDKALAPQADMRRDIGKLYMDLDRYDQALPQWNQWIAARPSDVWLFQALNKRCWIRAMLASELDKAFEDCNAALKLQRDNPAILDSRAWVHLRRGSVQDALNDFDRALKGSPDQAWSLYGRGIANMRQGAREAGMVDIDSARRLLPSIDEEAGRYGIAPP